MNQYRYSNKLTGKKQLKQLLGWSFSNYNCIEACTLADELKYLGFNYATKAGLSISIEDLKIPYIKHQMLQTANIEILNAEKICLKGKLTDVERFQKIIDTWNMTSESLKNEVISYFKNYDPLNSIYIMAFSGARGNISQVRQLVGMRGLMADPSGAILKLPIKKNFREGLTITDYLMSAYGARKGIVDTALKTANSGYLTRRLIDVAQDIVIREKDCFSPYSILILEQDEENFEKKVIGRLLNKPLYIPFTETLLADINTQINSKILSLCKQHNIGKYYIRSPLTCQLYRSICQRCYGWDIAKENLIDFGEAIGIIAGQSIGEPGTQLTMRTFHTGGIFTSEVSQQIKSPINGLIKFSKVLKTRILRTNKGENVLLTKNSGSLIIVPEENDGNLIQIELIRNTILFVKNNQYIKQNVIVGELLTNKKQIRTEITPILAPNSGEIIFPRLKNKHSKKKNLLFWLLSGQVYKGPLNSFLNYYSDYKINHGSYIYRTKIIAPFSGFASKINKKLNLFQKSVEISNNKTLVWNCILKKWIVNQYIKKYIVILKNSKCILSTQLLELDTYFGSLFTNKFRTLTGGTGYYINPKGGLFANKKYYYQPTNNLIFKYILQEIIFLTEIIYLINKMIEKNWRIKNLKKQWKNHIISIWNTTNNNLYSPTLTKTNFIKVSTGLIWLLEETHKLNCARNMLLVEEGNFISKNFEIFPSTFSKTQGIVKFHQNNNIIQDLSIQSGTLYQGQKLDGFSKNLYFPGEIIANDINIIQPSFCENIVIDNKNQLLIRPLEIYEIPICKFSRNLIKTNSKFKSIFSIYNDSTYFYKSNQKIRRNFSINLFSHLLKKKFSIIDHENLQINIYPILKSQLLKILVNKNVYINHYIASTLKYTNINCCLLVENNQYLNKYISLGYLESITNKSLKIVKIKSKYTNNKQIFLISNKDCTIIKKDLIKSKKVNQLLTNTQNLNCNGRIIIDNEKFLTIQKGRPYFFPNCKNDKLTLNQQIKYKIFEETTNQLQKILNKKNRINLQYIDITKKCLTKKQLTYKSFCSVNKKKAFGIKIDFSKMFLEKNNKLYIKIKPILIKTALIQNQKIEKNILRKLKILRTFNELKKTKKKKIKKLYIFFKTTNLSLNPLRNKGNNFLLLKMLATTFENSIGLYSLTDDYFEEDFNNVFCKNNQFVENGQTLGLLTFEKEITGDIVQGLPRIEQLFEARKVHIKHKLIPTNKKKYLLIQTPSIDSSFEFKKLGLTIKENEKINPHNLLKTYFNYYGSNRQFFCDQNQTLLTTKLMDNFEAAYRTFKKVQALILNLIQAVYNSQGVNIVDKHFEIIIKQMTTKILITHEGSTSLLPREVIDLYHIKYINNIMLLRNKKSAYYVPILFGITKAALNNPSFISAASFQETTRVLTKAAIEGKLDWLRGLKENIIIGQLIPAGTGSQTYRNCFKKKVSNKKLKLKDFS